jgi:hypothetical protein
LRYIAWSEKSLIPTSRDATVPRMAAPRTIHRLARSSASCECQSEPVVRDAIASSRPVIAATRTSVRSERKTPSRTTNIGNAMFTTDPSHALLRARARVEPGCSSDSSLKNVLALRPPKIVSAPDPIVPRPAATRLRALTIHCGSSSTVTLTATHASDAIIAQAPNRDHHSRFSSDMSPLASPTKIVAASVNERMNIGGANAA